MHFRTAVLALALLSSTPAFAAKKVALLIGNAAYTSATAALRNPPNDVAAMKEMLEAAEFEVTVLSNATRVSMSEALDAFSERAVMAEVGMVYYSGHGIELDGTNYLVPIDAHLKSDRSAKYEAVTLDDVISALSGATTLKLILLDACRDNPFIASMKRVATRGAPTRGLARVDTSDNNLLIGYATSPGAVASDGEGSNSPYAQALVRHITRPGIEIETALRAVAKEVHGRTGGEQTPFKTGSLFETVMLGPDAGLNVDPAGLPPVALEKDELNQTSVKKRCEGEFGEWDKVKISKERSVVALHAERFAACETAERAKTRLAVLEYNALHDARLLLDGLEAKKTYSLGEALQLDDPFESNFDPEKLAAIVENAILRGDKAFLDEMIENGKTWSSHFQDKFKNRLTKRGVYKPGEWKADFRSTHRAIYEIFGKERT